MKKTFATLLVLTALSNISAAIVHRDLSDVVIPGDGELHLLVSTSFTDSTLDPALLTSEPWITFSFGGSGIGTSDLVSVWTNQSSGYDGSTAGHFFQNVAAGSSISASGVSGSTGSFSTGQAVSIFHFDTDGGQFTAGQSGYLAFSYMEEPAGDVFYGWLRFTPQSSGSGFIVDYAYSDTPGEAITVGVIPEPSSVAALAGAFGLGFAAYRRRRAAV